MKILVYPKDPNPYQELLYRELRDKVVIKYLSFSVLFRGLGIFVLPLQLLYNRILGYKFFHLHWTYSFQMPINNIFFRSIATAYFIFCLFLIKLLGYKLIWTVHNVIPHEKQFINDVWVRKILSKLCDGKIVHSGTVIEEMKILGLDTRAVHVIPHGNYIDIYKNNITKDVARKYLNFENNDFIFLFFGRINEYKGVEDLLKVFDRLTKQRKVALLIAGKCDRKSLNKILSNYKNKFKDSIKIYSNFIEDKDVQFYFNCAVARIYRLKSGRVRFVDESNDQAPK